MFRRQDVTLMTFQLILDSLGSILSPFLCANVMYELTKEIQDEVPLCTMLADDIALIDVTRNEVNSKLE